MIDPHAAADGDQKLTAIATVNGVCLSARIMPAGGASGGGDWCESFALSDESIALSIGDICGHGLEKTADMLAVRQVIREAARRGMNPAQTLTEANRFLRGHDPEGTATAIFAVLDTRRRTLSFANAGHPAPLMCGPLGALYLEYADNDFPLGVEDELLPTTRLVSVPAATLLVFYTDGVSEHARDPLRGAAELHAATHFAYQVPSFLTASVIEKQMFLTGINRDDAAILTARTPLAPVVRDPFARASRIDITRLSGWSATDGEYVR